MGNRIAVGPILAGLLLIILILLMASLILSLLLHFTSIRESAIHWLILPITLLTLFIGGVYSGYKSGEKGWYVGGMTGLAFILVTWLISFLGFDSGFTTKGLLLYTTYLLLALTGGMVGVNMSPRKA